MLLGFLIRSEDDWTAWRTAVTARLAPAVEGGKSSAIVHVHDVEPSSGGGGGSGGERAGAVDEVQSCDEDWGEVDDDGDTVVC